MAVLTPGTVVRAREPTLLVENKLEVGSWRFRLTVVDDSGLESEPTDLVVQVVAPVRPVVTPVVTPIPTPVRPVTPVITPTPIRPLG